MQIIKLLKATMMLLQNCGSNLTPLQLKIFDRYLYDNKIGRILKSSFKDLKKLSTL